MISQSVVLYFDFDQLRSFHRYPDLIFHFANSHDLKTETAEQLSVETELLANYYSMYMPSTTKLIYFSQPHQEPELKPAFWKNMTYGGLKVSEQIQKHRDATINGIQRLVQKRPGDVHVFFDLFELGHDVAKHWGMAGVHKKDIWYATITKYLYSLLCGTYRLEI